MDDPQAPHRPPRLDAAEWRPTPPGPAPAGPYRTEEHATASGPADYALCVGDHVLAVVEAKKLTIGPQAFDVIVADECHRGYAAAEQSVRRGKPGCPGRWRWKGLTSGGGG